MLFLIFLICKSVPTFMWEQSAYYYPSWKTNSPFKVSLKSSQPFNLIFILVHMKSTSTSAGLIRSQLNDLTPCTPGEDHILNYINHNYSVLLRH